MSEELVFYTHPMSRGRIVRWMLEEVGQPYRTEILDYATSMKAPDYLAINPMGKVPALRHGDLVVTEAAGICAYLADAFPDAKLAPPPDSSLRAPYYRWFFFGAGPLESAIINGMLGLEVPPDRKAMAGYGNLADTTDALDHVLSGRDYMIGDSFSAVDVYVGSQLWFGMNFGPLEKRQSFQDYVSRVQARPAAVRAAAIDDALLPPGGPELVN